MFINLFLKIFQINACVCVIPFLSKFNNVNIPLFWDKKNYIISLPWIIFFILVKKEKKNEKRKTTNKKDKKAEQQET